MGIHDRHYIRRDPPRPGAYGTGGTKGWRTWSVNTWLIVICVGVFVVDGFQRTPTLFNAGAPRLFEGVSAMPDTAVIGDQAMPTTVQVTDSRGNVRTEQIYAKPVLLRPNGPQIGWQEVLPMRRLESWLHFSSYELFFRAGFWRLIGFQFLHANLTHLVFNMLGLFFFGPMVERYLGSKRYLAFYLLCGIFGALTYCALNLAGYVVGLFMGSTVQIPGLLFNDMHTPLIGASAGVFGVLMAGAYLAPNATVLLFFILPMRLATLAYVLVGIAIITLLTGGHNAGGEAGHLGGAIAGFYFIRHPRHLHGFFDFLGRIDPTSHHYRGKGAAVRARAVAKTPGRSGGGGRTGVGRAEIDRILDKINAEGLQSLTDKEKRLLREASEEG